jgi:hypothetical protein
LQTSRPRGCAVGLGMVKGSGSQAYSQKFLTFL